MCLIVKNDKPKIAKRNITCYKLLMVRFGYFMGNVQTEHYLSPYQTYYRWNIGEMATDKENWSIKTFPLRTTIGNDITYKIEQGGFHTFKSSKTALSVCENTVLLKFARETSGYRYVVVKCTIPKGTEYYYGENSDGEKSYCSKSLKLEHIIE